MSRVVGIDITGTHVRGALLHTAYRKTVLEDLCEVSRADFDSLEGAIAACGAQLGAVQQPKGTIASQIPRADAVAAAVDGRRCFVHRIKIPITAEKQLDELLPFELEAQIPVDLDDIVFDRAVGRRTDGDTHLNVLTVAARRDSVRETIDVIDAALQRQPERVGCSSVELGQLVGVCPDLNADGPLALIELGARRTDICILAKGHVMSARSLGLGTENFPGDAERLASQVRQTLGAHAAQSGAEVERVFLFGSGSSLQGVEAFFSDRLMRAVEPLPALDLEGATGDRATLVPRFARAIALATHLSRGKGFDLRQDDLAFQRGFGFLKERAPLLAGLGAAVLISFFFASYAENRALEKEHEVLATQLELSTKAAFDQATTDPDEADSLLSAALATKANDPMPYMDGFGVAVAFAESVDEGITHDIEELDFQKAKVKVRGIVSSTEEAQQIAKKFEEHRCIEDVNVPKISSMVGNKDREKYELEANVLCPEDAAASKKKKKTTAGGGS